MLERTIKIAAVVVLLFLFYCAGFLRGKEELVVSELVLTHSDMHHYSILNKIIEKESKWQHDLWGDSEYKYPAYGIAQFQRRTFYWLEEKAGFSNMDWKNPIHQLVMLDWALRNGYGHLWSTYNEAKEESEF